MTSPPPARKPSSSSSKCVRADRICSASKTAMMASAQPTSRCSSSRRRRAARWSSRSLYGIVSGTNKLGISVVAGAPVKSVLAYHGVPYVWGGELLQASTVGPPEVRLRPARREAPARRTQPVHNGQKVAVADLQPGDAVFFGSPVHHVGIYVGGGYFIHAPRTGDFVKISRLSDRCDYAGARRYAWTTRVGDRSTPPRAPTKRSRPADARAPASPRSPEPVESGGVSCCCLGRC